jgi:phospholipase C
MPVVWALAMPAPLVRPSASTLLRFLLAAAVAVPFALSSGAAASVLSGCGSSSAGQAQNAGNAGNAGDAGSGTDASAGSDAPGGSDGAVAEGGTWANEAGTCPSPIPTDSLASQRAACTFTTGAAVHDTLGISDAARTAIPVKHVIVVMKENRSFDHMLGALHTQGQPLTEAIPPTFTNLDSTGATVNPSRETTTCINHDPDHQWSAMHTQVDDGKMDGFVKSAASSTGTDGHFAMGHY